MDDFPKFLLVKRGEDRLRNKWGGVKERFYFPGLFEIIVVPKLSPQPQLNSVDYLAKGLRNLEQSKLSSYLTFTIEPLCTCF